MDMKPFNMAFDYVYWTKVLAAVVYGYVSAYLVVLFRTPLASYVAILAAAGLYVFLAEVLWRFSGKGSKRSSYLNGLGGFIGVFLLTWFLFFNVLSPTPS